MKISVEVELLQNLTARDIDSLKSALKAAAVSRLAMDKVPGHVSVKDVADGEGAQAQEKASLVVLLDDGGCFEGIFSDKPDLANAIISSVRVIDLDTEGADQASLGSVVLKSGKTVGAWVREYPITSTDYTKLTTREERWGADSHNRDALPG